MSQQMGEVRTAQGWGENTEDGGWRRAPSGGGWTFPGVSTSGKTSAEIGTWQNPSGSELWPGGSGTNVIVDSTDKEAWPSIGDETASDPGDDGASVKSGSMSSSSGQGVQSAEHTPSSLPPTSWAPGGSGFGLEGNTWGNPSTSANLSMGWSSASLPVSSQGHCMQSSSMAPSDTLSNSVMSNMSNSASIPSHGWGGMPGRGASAGSNQPQNSMSMQSSESLHGALPGSTGAQQTGPPVSTAHSGTGVNPLWQGGGGSNGGGAGYSGGGMPQYKAPDVKWTGKEGEGADRWGTGPDPGSFGGGWGEGAGSKPGGPGWDEGGQGGGPGGDNSWARGASKGGDPNGKPAQSPQEKMRMDEIRMAIESNEGWGSRPVKQDTAWDIEDTPTDRRKYMDPVGASAGMGANPAHSNVWNNNNGTAIWEPLRENPGSGSGGGGGPPHNWAGGGGGGSGGGGSGMSMRWDDDKDPSQWGGGRPSRPPDSWGNGGGGNGGGGGSLDKIGTWGGGGGDGQNKAWGGKTEFGSWGEPPGASGNNGPRSISTWGEPEQQQMPWEENPANRRPGDVDDGTAYWGRSNPSWSSQPSNPPNPVTPRNKPDENWARGPPNKPPSGWGEPGGAPGAKVDDGTSIWAANAQQQARAAGWGDTGSQWNPTPGARPKSTLGWGGDNDNQWNSNRKNPGRFPSMNNHHPQMRSKLLQQLMDMGFKKEEAQHALINNNMNLESAIAFLMNNGAKKDGDMDMFPPNGKARPMGDMGGPMVNDDLTDTHSESNPHVPNFSMQNTPFPNAQLQNQPFIPNPVNAQDRSKGPNMSQSSLAAGNSSINPTLQQRLLQHRQQQQQMHPPSLGGGGMGAPRGQIQPSQNVVQQQLAQQQILQQLRMAVQSGLISPQLLNQQLPHNILVMLQQLLQLQNVLQQLVNKQSQLLGNKMTLNPMQRQQLEGMPMMIQNIKTQIMSVQKQLAQAQQLLLKTQPPPQPGATGPQQPMPQQSMPQQQQQPPQPAPPSSTGGQGTGDDLISPLQSEMGSLSMQSSASQAQSRLTKWSRSVADKEGEEGLNKAVGSRPMHQSQSNPNLGSTRFEMPSFMGNDSTWSNTAAAPNWPTVGNDGGENKDGDDKDGRIPVTSSSLSCDIIPEFVPGKPWQGLAKSVEDDPHMTPGMIHRSLSVNVVDPSALKSSPTPGDSLSAWSTKDFPKSMQVSAQPAGSKAWSPANPADMWSSKQGQQAIRPPPSSSSLGKTNWNRQNSWAGRTDTASAFTPVNQQSSWESRPSSWLLLRNLNAQVDAGTLRALCQQHGPLLSFSLDPAHQQAAVRYSTREEAGKAQKALHGCMLSGASISAELLAEGEAARLMDTQPTSQWQQAAVGNSFHGGMPFGGSRLGELGTGWGSTPGAAPTPAYSNAGGVWSSSLWGGPQFEDHGPTPLLGNILSGEPA